MLSLSVFGGCLGYIPRRQTPMLIFGITDIRQSVPGASGYVGISVASHNTHEVWMEGGYVFKG